MSIRFGMHDSWELEFSSAWGFTVFSGYTNGLKHEKSYQRPVVVARTVLVLTESF